ncbi:MAG: hypothetical protein U9O95_07525, partial [Candidatus Marinimicrobia bacterium]|nr:hypothetical protein [Candidatus Neomarinimicrobiota bacterium]
VHISGNWFMAYRGNIPSEGDNFFGLKRGYITFKKNLNETFSIRYTQDITIDKEGSDAGNIELLFKYCYLKAALPEVLFFTQPFVEVGLVHRPWMEFEQKINTYRVQGKMFLERFAVISSADFGINAVTLLGGKLDDEAREKVKSSLPGKYGSLSLGVYNGGGYHAIEQNNNKTFEGRLTLRPFPGFMPGLQVTYATANGKGNDTIQSPFIVNTYYLSFENPFTTLAAQYYHGTGKEAGYTEWDYNGYSFFGEVCLSWVPVAIFGRYDHFHSDPSSVIAMDSWDKVYIGGIVWKFYKENRLLVDIEHTVHTETFPEPGTTVNTIAELALEIVF